MESAQKRMAKLVANRPSRAEALYRTFHNMNGPYRNNNHGVNHLLDWAYLLKPHSKILEVGCGNGSLCKLLSAWGHEVTGLDIVGGPYCRDGYEFILHDLQKGRLPFTDNTFDCVLCFDVLEHIHRRWSQELLWDIARVGGDMVASIACYEMFPGLLHLTVHTPDWWSEKFNRVCSAYDNRTIKVITKTMKSGDRRETVLLMGSGVRDVKN